MTNTNTPTITAEIVSAPAISNMTVTSVGKSMFSLNLNVVLVVRFPNASESTEQSEPLISNIVQRVSQDTSIHSSRLMYANGEQPEPGGETIAFNDFVLAQGYPPPSRQALSEWAHSQP